MLNMFRTLIHPSSGACDFSIVSAHLVVCSCFDVCWSFGMAGWGGIRVAGWSLPHGYHPSRRVKIRKWTSLKMWQCRDECKINKNINVQNLSFFVHFRHLRKNAKIDYQLRCVCLSLRPHGITQLPPERFSWNLKFGYVWNICRENSNLVQIGQELGLLYMKTNIYFWSYNSLSSVLRIRNV